MDIAARSENDKARKKSVPMGAGFCCPIFEVERRKWSRDISERDNQEYMYWW